MLRQVIPLRYIAFIATAKPLLGTCIVFMVSERYTSCIGRWITCLLYYLWLPCAIQSTSLYPSYPNIRIIYLVSIYNTTGNVTSSGVKDYHLSEANASVSYDYGPDGRRYSLIVTEPVYDGGSCLGSSVSVPSLSCGLNFQRLGLAYIEPSLVIGQMSDRPVHNLFEDETVLLPLHLVRTQSPPNRAENVSATSFFR